MKHICLLLIAILIAPMTTFALTDSQIQGIARRYERAQRHQNESDLNQYDGEAAAINSQTKAAVGASVTGFRITARDKQLPHSIYRAHAILDNGAECLMEQNLFSGSGASSTKMTCILGGRVIMNTTTFVTPD